MVNNCWAHRVRPQTFGLMHAAPALAHAWRLHGTLGQIKPNTPAPCKGMQAHGSKVRRAVRGRVGLGLANKPLLKPGGMSRNRNAGTDV